MSLLGRSESRTESGWQRFDRITFIVAAVLALVLLALSVHSRTGLLNPLLGIDPGGQDMSLAMQDAAKQPENAADATAAGNSDGADASGIAQNAPNEATQSDSGGNEPAGQSSTENTAENTADAVNGASTDASAADASADASTRDSAAASKGGENASPNSAAAAVTAAAGGAAQQAQADNAGRAGKKPQASQQAASDKSLASQDPDKQATFERIPININKPISAVGSPTGVAAVDGSAPGAQNGAPEKGTALATVAGKLRPLLQLNSTGGKLSIEGIVSDDDVRAEILSTALKTYGMRNLVDRLKVSGAVQPFDWAGNASDLMVLIGGADSETSIRIDGDSITLTGEVPALADKQARALAAQQFFGTTARVNNRLRVVAPAGAPVAKGPVAAGAADPTLINNPAKATQAEAGATAPDAKPASATGTPTAVAKAPAATGGAIDAAGNVPGTAQDPAAAAGEAVSNAGAGNAAGDGKQPGALAAVIGSGPDAAEAGAFEPAIDPRPVPKNFGLQDCAKVTTGIRIPFASGGAELTPAGMTVLDTIERCLTRRRYVVGGHTDGRGGGLNNLILSQARAQAAIDYLVSKGVPAGSLIPKGYGESRPIASNKSQRGRALNRRIDFRFVR